MFLSFVRPEYLLLLLALPLVWLLGWLNQRGRMAGRRWAALAVRTLLILCLVGSIAGAQVVQPVENLTTVFLLDSSDSVSPGQRSANEQFIAQALEAMQDGDKAAIVAFGENALVERVPSELKRLGQIQSVPIAARTNISQAIQLGLALFPADTQKRLVLLSDGGENVGQAMAALRIAGKRNVPIDIVPTGGAVNGPEVAITDLRAPGSARTGQEIQLVATVESNLAQAARLRFTGDNTLLAEQDVQLPAGTATFTATVEVGDQGFHRYGAEVVPASDTRPQNNIASSLVDVGGPPRVLIVEGVPGEAANAYDALLAAELSPDRIPATALPSDLPTLSEYEAIMLVNVASRDIPEQTQRALKSYVGDLGRGLLMIGGKQSFGVGGFTKTPIEEALPVDMDVRNRQQRPDIALVFIIDKSGSMDACHCDGGDMGAREGGGTRKIDIAKEAVVEAATVLGQEDKLGVVTFDEQAHWTINTAKIQSLTDIEGALAPVPPNGQTNVLSGMQAGLESLRQTDAKIKHAILLTDGWSRSGDIEGIAAQMNQEGITLSVVAAGNGSSDALARIAEAGGGRYYPAKTMEEVPQIFLQETIQAVGTYIIEEPFTPAYAADSPILAGLQDGLPQLLGYNGTAEKDSAQVVLVGSDGSPVLAQWQFGLGRSVAWTSDLKGQWASNWVGWEEFPRFVAQMVGWTLPRVGGDTVSGEASLIGTEVQIDLAAQDAQGANQTDLIVEARLVGANETTKPAGLTEVAPGRYQARLPSPVPGTYLVQITGADRAGKPIFARTLGLIVPYSPEYRQGQSNAQLLQTLAAGSGGRSLSEPARAFDHTLDAVQRAIPIELLLLTLAALLLLLDVAVRRLSLRRSDLALARSAMRGRQAAAAAPSATVAGLQQAKSRAKDRMLDKQPAPIAPAGEDAGAGPVRQPAKAAPPADAGRQPTQPITPPPSAPAPDPESAEDPLERLRAAKNRARRR
ncbi:MAG TPA: VWA domain-containing protein [Herpetosiphonaceae bacterium]